MKLVGSIILFVLFFEAASVEAVSDIIVSYREVHMDTKLSCSESIVNKKWYFYTEPDATVFQPITAENGSHYEINENIAGLRIIDTVEADEGYYLVQGNGGMRCRFQLNVYGLFSYNSGSKVLGTGNYEETLYGVEGYAVTIPCDYSITEVSGAENTSVNVDAVVNNVNVMDCEERTYPYCTSCEACFPLLNNPFRQFVLFPNKGSDNSTLRCRVNLGTPYNGKTVDKQITVSTRAVTSETVAFPYNKSYPLCSNAPGDWNGAISTTTFSGGLPTNQMEYSANNLSIIVLVNNIEVSCQNLDSMGFPIADQIYRYNITIIECPSGMTLTLTIVPIDTTPSTQPNATVTPTTEPLESGILAGIISGAILCVIFVAVLVALLVVAVLLYIYCWLPDRPRSYKNNSIFNHDPQKVRYTKPDDPPIVTV